jgi:RNA polymerase sigma factor (sigma-70 family)
VVEDLSSTGVDRTRGAASANGDADSALVAAARRDRRAFEAIYRRYAGRVYRYTRARVDSDAAAEDITSETMLAALEGLDRWDARQGAFASWLFTIAARRVSDRYRRRGRFRRVLERAWQPDALEDDALTSVIRADDVARLHARLDRLPERDRDLVLLRYHAELTSNEIAEVLGMTSSAVRVRLMRVLNRLANDLDKDDA